MRSFFLSRLLILAAVVLGPIPTASAELPKDVVAVVAGDSYRDLKKQLTWLGREVGQPALAGMAEGLLGAVTGGRGLAGLDVRQPFGIVITASADGQIAGCGCVPVKDIDALLTSLQGLTGPVERQGDTRRLTMPGGSADIVERNGWAMIAPTGLPLPADLDPQEVFATLTDDFTLAVKLLPTRLPEPLRDQLAQLAIQAANQAPAAGGPNPADAMAAMVDGLSEIESMTLGIGVDEEQGRVVIENRTVAVPGSPGAVAAEEKATLSVPLPQTGKPMLQMMLAQSVTPEVRQQMELGLTQAAQQNADPRAAPVIDLLAAVLGTMLDSGRLDATLAVTSEGTKTQVTGGARVADGRRLESVIKKAVGQLTEAGQLPPGLGFEFDVDKVGTATLHTLTIDPAQAGNGAARGEPIPVTLAITPTHAYALAGGDISSRLDGLVNGSQAERGVKPGMAVQLACEQLLDFIIATGANASDLAPAAEAARAAPSAMLQMVVRPIDRGFAWQLTADGGVLRAVAAMAATQGLPGQGGGPGFGPPGGFDR